MTPRRLPKLVHLPWYYTVSLVVCLALAWLLAGCPGPSNNSNNRTLNVAPCPQAESVGDGSCNASAGWTWQ